MKTITQTKPKNEATTELHDAVRAGDIDRVTLILAAGHGKLINQRNMMGQTPLHLAAEQGSRELCNLLLQAGADPLMMTADGFLPLSCAVVSGNFDVVRLLTSICTALEAPVPGACGALELALIHNHMAIAEYLWRHGADLQSEDSERGYSTLIYRMAEGGRAAAVKFLIEKLVDPAVWNSTGHAGVSPIRAAITNGHYGALREMLSRHGILQDLPEWAPGGLKIVRCNIEIRAKVLIDIVRTPLLFFNATNESVDHALTVAVMNLDPDAVKKTLSNGANPNYVSLADNSVLMEVAARAMAVSSNTPEKQAAAGEILSDLVAAGADMNRTYPPRRLVFLSALVKTGRQDLVRQALSLGAIVNIADSFGNRPLHTAVRLRSGNHEMDLAIMRDLIDAGADLEAFNDMGVTPMQHALIHSEHPEKIALLLQSGANPDLRTMGGQTLEQILAHPTNGNKNDPLLLNMIHAARAQRSLKNIFSRKNPMSGVTRLFGGPRKKIKKTK